MKFRWLILPLLVSFPASALAQSPGVLGKDDAEYARLLFERGYTDLSERLLALIEKSGKVSSKEEANVKALRLAVRTEVAMRESDPFKKKDALEQILTEKEDLINQFSGSRAAEDTATTLADAYSMLGGAVLACINREKDPNLVAQLQAEGKKIFDNAQASIEKRIETLKEKRDDPAFEGSYIAALFSLPKTLYFHSLLYPEGEWARKDKLEKAIELFQEFGLDYGDRLFNYEGLIFIGLAYKDLGQKDDALSALRDAIALREGFEQDKNGVYLVDGGSADIISKAVLQKVNMLAEGGDARAAVEAGKDFFKTVLDAEQSQSGLAVLAAMGNALLASGDTKGADETAARLIELDPVGPWGGAGQDIRDRILRAGTGGGFGSAPLLKIAGSLAGRGQAERAIQVARQAIAAARDEKDGTNNAVDAWLLIGSLYVQRGWNHEAAVAFDACADKYPSAEKAPEAVYQALQQYVQLASAERKPIFRTRVEERRKTLTTRYANHERAAFALLVEGDQLVNEGKFLEAVEQYAKVQPTSPAYLDGQFKKGSAYYSHARKLVKDGKAADAKPFFTQAEDFLKKCVADFDKASTETVNLEKQARMESGSYRSRILLSDLYLNNAKPADVLGLLEGSETRFANDGEKLAQIWGLRIRAYQSMDKLDDAIKLLDALAKKDPTSKAIGPAAGLVARELDRRGQELSDGKKQADALKVWQRAADYYAMSGRAILKSENLRLSDVESIAKRLYVLGLLFNNVPENQISFIGWDAKKLKETKLWELASELYQAGLRVSPSTEAQLTLARMQGFLGRWKAAAAAYETYFDTQGSLFDSASGKLLRGITSDVILAKIEEAVCEEETALADNDAERFLRAEQIFRDLDKAVPVDSDLWWYSRYYLVKTLYDKGDYRNALSALKDAERATNVLGGKTNLVSAFVELKKNVETKAGPR